MSIKLKARKDNILKLLVHKYWILVTITSHGKKIRKRQYILTECHHVHNRILNSLKSMMKLFFSLGKNVFQSINISILW